LAADFSVQWRLRLASLPLETILLGQEFGLTRKGIAGNDLFVPEFSEFAVNF
jgi:hypothetical protein